jgi:hypothetical protein
MSQHPTEILSKLQNLLKILAHDRPAAYCNRYLDFDILVSGWLEYESPANATHQDLLSVNGSTIAIW